MTEEMMKVKPVHCVDDGDTIHRYTYTFTEAHPDEVDVDEVYGVTIHHHDGYIVWDHPQKPDVEIHPDGAYVSSDVSRREGEKQAYYALSIMNDGCDQKGESYVSNWREA